MHYPHFHFAGRFRADTATLNNFPNYFDTENFTQSDTRPNFDNWNPLGSGEWAVEAEVTHVCYSDVRCVGNQDEEPLYGTGITGICNKLINVIIYMPICVIVYINLTTTHSHVARFIQVMQCFRVAFCEISHE